MPGFEIDEHLQLHQERIEGRGARKSRKGSRRKPRKGDHGEVEIATPRDRNGTFESQLGHSKGQTRLTRFNDQILALDDKGMSTRDRVHFFNLLPQLIISLQLR